MCAAGLLQFHCNRKVPSTDLACRLSIQPKHLPHPLLADSLWSVDLVAQDQDRHISNGLICH